MSALVPIELIRETSAAQPRVQMDLTIVDEYARDMADGALFPPIVVFHDGEVYWLADGFHRVYAARRNGIKEMVAYVHQGGLRDAVLHSVGANASHGARRTNADKQNAVMRLLSDNEWSSNSNRWIAERCKVSEWLVRSLRESRSEVRFRTKHGTTAVMKTANIGRTAAIEDDVRLGLMDNPMLDSQADVDRLARLSSDLQHRVFEVVERTGATSLRKAWQHINEANDESRRSELLSALPSVTDRWEIHHRSAAGLIDVVPEKSVDAIVTDPPYPSEYLGTFDELAQLARHALRDGGLVVAMVGKHHLPEYINRLIAGGLTYHWTAAMLMTETPRIWDRKVFTGWKPLLVFTVGEYDGPMFNDVVKPGASPDKDLHEWEQDETTMLDIVDRFTRPGTTVLDPFVGSGTTGVAAIKLDRRFIGGDVDEAAVATSRKRLSDVVEAVA